MKTPFRFHVLRFLTATVVAGGFLSAAFAEVSETQSAQNIFRRMTGLQLPATDARIVKMAALIKKGDAKAAALIATDDLQFLSGTIVPLAAKLGSRENNPGVAFNDFQALFTGVVRDNLDARELMTGNYAYQFKSATPRTRTNNTNYDSYGADPSKLASTELVKIAPQWPDQPERDVAGLLTTRGWAEAHLSDGTNRRAVERTFNMFLCAPIESWRDVNVDDGFVGRDVPRDPSGDPALYQSTCRGCHGNMDALRPAFGHLDFANGRYVYLGSFQIANKYAHNSDIFPSGYAVASDFWENRTVESYDALFGWHGPTSGNGIHDLGALIANSDAYKKCFARRAYTAVCRKDADKTENTLIDQLADDFAKDNYSVKSLFANTATKANCF